MMPLVMPFASTYFSYSSAIFRTFVHEKKVHLQKLYDRFSTDAFIAQGFCEVLDVKKQSISYRLEEFIDRRIIMVGHKSGQNYYRLTVTPKEHPECFQEEIALVVN